MPAGHSARLALAANKSHDAPTSRRSTCGLFERGGVELASFRDRVLVFDKPSVLPRLAQGKQTFIPVAFTREVERELAPFSRSMHSVVVYPRNAANSEPHITLEPVGHEIFRTSLEAMKKDRDEVARLDNASGRSLTVLRRQLSNVPAVKTPEWATDQATATSLIPFLFVGAWNSRNEIDKLGLSLLAGDRSYEEIEKTCQNLVRLNDAPVWSIGTFRGVISKIDLLYAIAGTMTPDDLRRYFSLARMVLGEDDPTLDVPEEERWATAVHGKVREFSSAFREGISETLVLLAVHGNNLFKNRLGVDTEVEAARVVSDLLSEPLTTRVLEANDRDLPTYAEAAPETFLSISHKPRWRPDGYGFGEPFPTMGPIWAFMREMVEMALTRKSYSLDMLGDLVTRTPDLLDEHQTRVWSLVKAWADDASDDDKAALREKTE